MSKYPIKVLRYFAELNKQKNKPLFLAGRDLSKTFGKLEKVVYEERKTLILIYVIAITIVIVYEIFK